MSDLNGSNSSSSTPADDRERHPSSSSSTASGSNPGPNWGEVILYSALMHTLLSEITTQKRNEALRAAQAELERQNGCQPTDSGTVNGSTGSQVSSPEGLFRPITHQQPHVSAAAVQVSATGIQVPTPADITSTPTLSMTRLPNGTISMTTVTPSSTARRPTRLKVLSHVTNGAKSDTSPGERGKPYVRVKHASGNEDADREVAAVLAGARASQPRRHTSPLKTAGPLRVGVSPLRPCNVMTNVSRGNQAASTPVVEDQQLDVFRLAAMGEFLALQELQQRGEDLDQQDRNGHTPLFWAASYDQAATAKFLLERGANVNHRTKNGECALLLAAAKGHTRSVSALLEYGAQVNQAGSEGNTPLHYAAYCNRPAVARVLLEHGAFLDDTNSQNWTALELAAHLNHREVQAAIERHVLKILQ